MSEKKLKAIPIRRHVSDAELEPGSVVNHGYVVSRVDLNTAAEELEAKFKGLRFVGADNEVDWVTMAMFLNMAIRDTGLVPEFRVPVNSDGTSFTYRNLVTQLYNTQRALANTTSELWETRKQMESLTVHKLWRVYSPEGLPLFVVDKPEDAQAHKDNGLVVRQMCSVDEPLDHVIEPDRAMIEAAQKVAYLTPYLAGEVWRAMERARLGSST